MRIKMRIREVRESKGISLSRLSEMTHISKSHLSNVEREEKEPSFSIMVRIALALKVQIEELYNIHY
ncbi:MAG: helix-turn-helix transcriptional regulator [Clostridia bacterium]|nr:helix-turn-helix transcriptional regulator [Clostridia bacterium]